LKYRGRVEGDNFFPINKSQKKLFSNRNLTVQK
jgi:hypothetical protein